MTLANINEISKKRDTYVQDGGLHEMTVTQLQDLANTFDMVVPQEMPKGGIIRAIAMFLFPYPNQEKEVASGAFTVKCVANGKGASFKVKLKVNYPE